MTAPEKHIQLGIFAQTPTGWLGNVGKVAAMPNSRAVSLVPDPRRTDPDPVHSAHCYRAYDPQTGEQIGIISRSTKGMPHWTGRIFDMNVSASVPPTVAKADDLPRLIVNWRVERPLIPFDLHNPPPIEERRKRIGEGA